MRSQGAPRRSRGAAQAGRGSAIGPKRWTLALAAAVLVCQPAAPASAETTQDYPGHFYSTAVNPGPSADKPQSKLWRAEGSWWAVLLNGQDAAYHIYRLAGDHNWVDTGTVVDRRATSHADVLVRGDRLYVVSTPASGAVRFYRLSYDQASSRYAQDAGFPVDVPAALPSSAPPETVTVARDSTGTLWVTYEQGSRIWVTRSETDGVQWSAPFQPTGAGADTAVASDDISAVVNLDGRIGVMWSDQNSDRFGFATHQDGAGAGAWEFETALAGTDMADDHLNLKLGVDGRLYAAVKSSKVPANAPPDAPSLMLLVRTPGGAWSNPYVYSRVADKLTRPVVSLDEENRRVLMYVAREGGGTAIHYKSAPMDDIDFGTGPGARLMFATGASLNNPTTTKQVLDSSTDAVVLAADEAARRYRHAEVSIDSPDLVAPTAPTDTSATATSARSVRISWTGSTDNVGVVRYTVFRDGARIGSTSSTTFLDETASPDTTYAYSVDAVDAAGNHSAQSAPASATTPPAPPSQIEFRGATTGANATAATLTVARPAQVAAGDTLVATVAVRGNTTITPRENGWTRLRRDVTASAMSQAIYYRRADGSEPASYTWDFPGAQAAAGGIAAYDGVDSASPVDVHSAQPGASSASIVAPSVSTTVSDTRLVGMFGIARATTVAPPPGMTERGEAASTAGTYKVALELADSANASTGATGDRTAAAAGAARNIGQLVALKPE